MIERINPETKIIIRRFLRNKRKQQSKKWIKLGLLIPNSMREALILDTKNKNHLWTDAIKKEMIVLDSAGTFQYKSPNYNIPTD